MAQLVLLVLVLGGLLLVVAAELLPQLVVGEQGLLRADVFLLPLRLVLLLLLLALLLLRVEEVLLLLLILRLLLLQLLTLPQLMCGF